MASLPPPEDNATMGEVLILGAVVWMSGFYTGTADNEMAIIMATAGCILLALLRLNSR